MLFHSQTFLIFFLLFLMMLPFFKGSFRIYYVVAASYLFYGYWYLPYLSYLIAFTLFAHFAASHLSSVSRNRYLLIALMSLLPLCIFKYSGFILTNLDLVFGTSWARGIHWQLPLGISFITFTVIAYLIDVRRGAFRFEPDLSRTALYIAFFPHLIAGPIMRPKELFPQLNHISIKRSFLRIGIFLFAIGMFKKVVIADQIAPLVDQFYREHTLLNLPRTLFLFYAFPWQIYCDFSGYTDMALALAFIIGVRLPLNFNRPYLAESVRDFWHRWHITLSRWLRDYLYFPLGGNRYGWMHTAINLMITMLLGGLWHGAAWTFIAWGALHGLLLAGEYLFRVFVRVKFHLPILAKQIIAFHIIAFTWFFFRSNSLAELSYVLTGFLKPDGWKEVLGSASFPIGLILLCFLLHRWDRVSLIFWLVRHWSTPFVYGLALTLFVASVALSVGNPNRFVYFDF